MINHRDIVFLGNGPLPFPPPTFMMISSRFENTEFDLEMVGWNFYNDEF